MDIPKGISYRMSPENAGCLAAAGVDCCVLGNNHMLDWGRAGLCDTLATLEHLRIKTAGAGRDAAQASAPAILEISDEQRVCLAVKPVGKPDAGNRHVRFEPRHRGCSGFQRDVSNERQRLRDPFLSIDGIGTPKNKSPARGRAFMNSIDRTRSVPRDHRTAELVVQTDPQHVIGDMFCNGLRGHFVHLRKDQLESTAPRRS
jgi:hypothetical protein